MQQTLVLRNKDPKNVHAVPSEYASHTVCGVSISDGDEKEWNEKAISCPVCLSVIIRRMADEYDYYGKQNPSVIAGE